MTSNARKIEEVIQKALELKDKGKTSSYILNLYPENREELSDIFMITDALQAEKIKIKSSDDLLKKIILRSHKFNNTESIRRRSNTNSNRFLVNGETDGGNNFVFNSSHKGRALFFSNLLTTIKSNMNKKLLSGIGIILILIAIGAGTVLTKRKAAPSAPNESKFAVENEINAEKRSFDQDVKDINELESDTFIDDVNSDISEINSDIKTSLPPNVDGLDAMEKELAYELDSFLSDLESSQGIENDTSLNTLNAQISGISS